MALEYPLDRQSTLSFGRFGEYSQLLNLGNRKSTFHLTSSATLTKNNGVDLQAPLCLSHIIFMQDGAPPHITRCVKDTLKHLFTEERVISHQFRHLWPPRLPDLNLCDFWLWGHLKQLVSCNQPRTLPDLKDSISQHVLNISQNTVRSTEERAILRFQIVSENYGHVEHLLL
ncbi:uncharacterized protein TNCV_721241 [Trichonephila clavipes]|nr:uncharacterized protein TNCV_721241 [Trichonephila clavipes]